MFGLFQRKEKFTQADLQQAAVLNDIHDYTKHTKDGPLLETKHHQWVFLYCSLMKDYRDHHHIAGRCPNAPIVAYTRDHYTMWKHKLGMASYPIAVDKKYHNTPHVRIRGELYLIPSDYVAAIDSGMNNLVEYGRRRMQLVVPYTERSIKHDTVLQEIKKSHVVEAWGYIGKPSHWDDILDYRFVPVKTFTSSHTGFGDYYYFGNRECQD